MKTLLYSLFASSVFVLFSFDELFAQPGRGPARAPSGQINGSILADESGEGIPGAAVAVWNAEDSTLVTGVIGKIDGTFAVEGLRPGRFYVKITSLGYAPHTLSDIAIKPEALQVDLGEVRLLPDTVHGTEEVTVSTERSEIEFHSDRTVYNVEDQPATAGGTAIDVLKNVPQLQVDANDVVSMRGSQNVAVHLNGRPIPLSGEALAGFLKGLSADMIKSVEIIPNPSAKYDPEGMAGILNIVLKQQGSQGGSSGNISLSAETSNSYGAVGSYALRANRFNLFTSYGFQYEERHSDATQYQENRLVNPVSIFDVTTASFGITRGHVFNGTLDYSLNKENNSTLSFSTVLNKRGGLIEENNTYRYRETGGETPGSANRSSLGSDDWLDMDYSLNWRRVFEPQRHELTVEGRYTTNNVDTKRHLTEHPFEAGAVRNDTLSQLQDNNLENFNRGAIFQVDYTRPIGEKGRLETGYKGDLTHIDNTFYSESFNPQMGEFQPDINLNNEFKYDVQIHGLYATYGHTFGKIDAQIGLRAEQAYTDFTLVTNNQAYTNDYFSLFPSASLLWSPDDTRRIQLSYSKRITRPRTWQLNPFVNYEDRLNLNVGNPSLRPEYSHSVELGLNQYMPWGVISISPYFRQRHDFIERWASIDTNGVTTIRTENFNSTNSYGAEVVGSYRIKDRFNGYANLSLYHFDLDGGNVRENLANDAFGWYAYATGTWTVVSGLDIQASYFYRATIKISQGEIKPYHAAGLAIKKSLFGDRASLALNVDDIFNTGSWDLYKDDPTYYTDLRWTWTSQVARLNFSWNFGRPDPSLQRRLRQGGGGDDGGAGGPGGV